MKKPKVHVLLSTYNGEKYLREQLDSIFDQTYENFTLYIRDDGSSDQTLEIIKQYEKDNEAAAGRIKLLEHGEGKNIGWQRSFWLLLEQCGGADYYAFCHQDDVWLPKKIEVAVDMLQEEENNKPLLYYANYNYCDENLNIGHEAPRPHLPLEFKDVMMYTPAFGFAIVINEKLRCKCLETTDKTGLAHDGWVQKIAASMGKILYDETSVALYRRHGNAVTSGNSGITASIVYWLKQEVFGNKMKQEIHYPLDRFLQEYGEQISEQNRNILTLFAGKTENPLKWFKRLTFPKRLRPSMGGEVALRVCFFLNKY